MTKPAKPNQQKVDAGRKGGTIAQAKGTAHKWTKEEAQFAGQKGGKTVLSKYGPKYYSRIGGKGRLKKKCPSETDSDKKVTETPNDKKTSETPSTLGDSSEKTVTRKGKERNGQTR